MFYWIMKYVVIGPIMKALFRPWIVGRKNIPATGSGHPREQPPLGE